MEFFNKKQEVIEIQLTQFGKNLMSRGAFKPVYYQLFDDGIIYDYSHHGVTETQNEIEERIFQTQRIKDNHNVSGVQENFELQTEKIQKSERDVFLNLTRNQDPLIKEKILKTPLSTVSRETELPPRFEMELLEVKTKDTEVKFIISDGYDIKIPQIEVNPIYTIKVDQFRKVLVEDPDNKELFDDEVFFDLTAKRMEFFDNTVIEVASEDISIDLTEYNTLFDSENFEIELYEIVETDGKTRNLKMEDNKEIFDLFDIHTDETVDIEVNKPPRRRFFVK